jgi:hypothetical protein
MGEVCSHAEPVAQVARERANVGARTHDSSKADLRCTVPDHLDPVDRDADIGQLDRLTPPSLAIAPLTVDVLRGILWRLLELSALKLRQRCAHHRLG